MDSRSVTRNFRSATVAPRRMAERVRRTNSSQPPCSPATEWRTSSRSSVPKALLIEHECRAPEKKNLRPGVPEDCTAPSAFSLDSCISMLDSYQAMGEIFGTDGIRDRAGQGFLAPDKVTQVARASAAVLGKSPAKFRSVIPKAFRHLAVKPARNAPGRGRVITGRDTRASGPGIEAALAAGFQSLGIEVALAGVLSTPRVATLTPLWGGALGVVISASHNPAEDNGIKLISPQGFKIPDGAEDSIEKLLKGKPLAARVRKPKAALDLSSKTSDYPDFLAGFCRPLKGMTI